MAECMGNGVKLRKLINAQHEGYSITRTILKVHQCYYGYIVKFNAKT